MHGSVAQLNRASDFGSEGWGFESLRGHHISRFNIFIEAAFSFLTSEIRNTKVTKI